MFLSSQPVTSVAFSPCGKWITTGSWDKTVRIWDAASGAAVGSPLTVDAGFDGVLSVCFSPTDNVIAAGCSNGNIYLVDAQAGEVKSVSFSPDGKFIASGSFDKTIKIWDAKSGGLESTLTGHRYDPFPCIECLLS